MHTFACQIKMTYAFKMWYIKFGFCFSLYFFGNALFLWCELIFNVFLLCYFLVFTFHLFHFFLKAVVKINYINIFQRFIWYFIHIFQDCSERICLFLWKPFVIIFEAKRKFIYLHFIHPFKLPIDFPFLSDFIGHLYNILYNFQNNRFDDMVINQMHSRIYHCCRLQKLLNNLFLPFLRI